MKIKKLCMCFSTPIKINLVFLNLASTDAQEVWQSFELFTITPLRELCMYSPKNLPFKLQLDSAVCPM